jgi:hypothetical protein
LNARENVSSSGNLIEIFTIKVFGCPELLPLFQIFATFTHKVRLWLVFDFFLTGVKHQKTQLLEWQTQ